MEAPFWQVREPSAGLLELQYALGNLSLKTSDAAPDPMNANARASVHIFRAAVHNAAKPPAPVLPPVVKTIESVAAASSAPFGGAPRVEIGPVEVGGNELARRSFSASLLPAPSNNDRR